MFQQLGRISFMFSLTLTPSQIQKLKLYLYWEEFILSNLLFHTYKLSALLDMSPTTLLEEESWKGIGGIPIKFVGTQFSVFMHKLK